MQGIVQHGHTLLHTPSTIRRNYSSDLWAPRSYLCMDVQQDARLFFPELVQVVAGHNNDCFRMNLAHERLQVPRWFALLELIPGWAPCTVGCGGLRGEQHRQEVVHDVSCSDPSDLSCQENI